jgi:hypothetical protein
MNLISGMMRFVLGGVLFAVGIIGLVAMALTPPIKDLWGKLGSASVSLIPAVVLLFVFFILFLAGFYIMKIALSRGQG